MQADQPQPQAKTGLSINGLLLLCFAIIASVPIVIFGTKVYHAAWDNVWREVREKHQLLAENLAAPISIYVNSHKSTLKLTGEQLLHRDLLKSNNQKEVEHVLHDSMVFTEGLCGLFLLDRDLNIINSVTEYKPKTPIIPNQFAKQDFVEQAFNHKNTVSPVILNPLTKQPSIYIAVPMYSGEGVPSHILIGELKIAPIEKLRLGIRFGKGGHSAIVDNLGRVLAHPNPGWMKDQIKDLSHLKIIQQMMAGKTGVTEFYSPFIKDNMVAGYTAVPNLGWGVMVPQPKAEVEAQVRNILYNEFSWAIIGLVLAIITAGFLGRWITSPLNKLATAAHHLARQGFKHNLPFFRSAPAEIQQLGNAFRDAINVLSQSREEVQELNESLQQKIDEATIELRRANQQLSILARSDHLTGLANRRHFEHTIASLCSRRQEDSGRVSLLLVDVDHFKSINDQYGHAAGDMVLSHIAELLDRNMRQYDLAARYAGDEFIVLIRADESVARERATNILAEIEKHRFLYNDESLTVTVSIGLFSFDIGTDGNDIKSVLNKVDDAMYQAKNQGRNNVAEIG